MVERFQPRIDRRSRNRRTAMMIGLLVLALAVAILAVEERKGFWVMVNLVAQAWASTGPSRR